MEYFVGTMRGASTGGFFLVLEISRNTEPGIWNIPVG
jgi:hypothetical protein